MKINRQAFTLIELLVVVLIIGILAAVAIPQYRLAVDRARLSNLLVMLNAVAKSQEVYYAANSSYALDWDSLDISFADTTPSGSCRVSESKGYTICIDTSSRSALAFVDTIPDVLLHHFYSNHHLQNYQNKQVCYANAENQYGNRLCKAISGKSTRDTQIGNEKLYNVYFISN